MAKRESNEDHQGHPHTDHSPWRAGQTRDPHRRRGHRTTCCPSNRGLARRSASAEGEEAPETWDGSPELSKIIRIPPIKLDLACK